MNEPVIGILHHIKSYNKTVIVENNIPYSYLDLDLLSDSISSLLVDNHCQIGDRVLLLINPRIRFTAAIFAVWKCGAVAVPMFLDSPTDVLSYYIEDSGAIFFLVDDASFDRIQEFSQKLKILNIQNISTDKIIKVPVVNKDADALIIYTSGTSGKPKGVLTTHRIIESQITVLVEAWKWSENDCILNILPLHHVHGLVNALLCPIYVGATVVFLPKFKTASIWEIFVSGKVNVFMAVPTIYAKLLDDYAQKDIAEQDAIKNALSAFRLMVSGSAALPLSTFNKWKDISGQILLERYGMTEIGMAISNPYEADKRMAGFVGKALPGVQVRLVNEKNIIIDSDNEPGEIQIKGPNVFKSYWNRDAASLEVFTKDAWFKTGDMAIVNDGFYKILGRLSSDIIKSAAYKISALEIEEILRMHPYVSDAAVLGLADETWGELVAAVLILKNKALTTVPEELKQWLKLKLPSYKMPRKWHVLENLPRNDMGKTVKNELKKYF